MLMPVGIALHIALVRSNTGQDASVVV